MTEDDAADRAGEESDEERRVGEQRAGDRIVVGKEQLVEYDRRHHAVEKKIVPLDGGADSAGQCDLADRHAGFALWCRLHGSLPLYFAVGLRAGGSCKICRASAGPAGRRPLVAHKSATCATSSALLRARRALSNLMLSSRPV